jgi:hypothetical protein
MSDLELLTISRLSVARSCQRQHQIRYELGYRPVEIGGARKFGTLVHRALEAWWLALAAGKAHDECLADAIAAVRAGGGDPFEAAKAEAMIVAYHHRWKDEPYDVLAVEQEFRAPLRNPSTGALSRTWELAGKIDVIVRDRNTGRVLIVEHKTSSEDITPGSGYWRRLRMDGQVSVYFVGADSVGMKADACLYDVLGKPAQKPYKATPESVRKYTKEGKLHANQRDRDETPEEYGRRVYDAIAEEPGRYLARGEVVRLESEMEGALVDVWQQGQQLREARIAGRAPRNPGACVQWGRECDYFAICSGEASLDDTTKFAKSASVHPELSAAVNQETKEESSQCQQQ